MIKTAIAFLSFFYIYLKLEQYNEQELFVQFDNSIDLVLLMIVVLLMPLNWYIESVKWKYLIRKIEIVKVLNAIKAVFSGIAFAIFTPNRIGELAGRIFVLKKENRIKAVFSTAVGSLSQMMITLFLGFIGGIFFLYFYSFKLPESTIEYLLYVKVFSVISVLSGFLIFFNLKFFIRILKKIKLSEKIIKPIEIITEYSIKELVNILAYSFIRYSVFAIQFYILLVFFKVDISFVEAIICISLTYFVSSVIPSFTLTEIGIRGSAALFFMGMFSGNEIGIISATALIWIINLAIPAIIGAFIFYRTKI
ncbi:MAG: flippase-like domain-containing protein [Bacteroidales bacterium]|nr:flippase-like domain-containing protein [Bacteroidales bacterium]